MSSSTIAGSPEAVAPGFCAAPPPPPPPPPVPGQMPGMRISTAEAPTTRRTQLPGPDIGYEPPAAIQNAMLTKDKKPFTYTPGMGGKLDLSQIRSPRMARRVAKNANDEGIEGPPKAALESKPTTPQTAGASLFVQPQVAVPVFPTNAAPQTPINRSPQVPILNRLPSNAADRQSEPTTPKIVAKEEPKVTPIQINTVQQPNTPDSPGTPQVTLAKAPTPWLQNKNKQQEELPEWAKRASVNKTANSSAESTPSTQAAYATNEQTRQTAPQWQQPQQRQPPQQYQYQQYQPQSPQAQGQPYQQKRQVPSPTIQQQERPAINQQQGERVIPIRIEDRPSVFAVKQEPGHHQFKQPPSVHHQQRWGQTSPQNQVQQPQVFVSSSPQPQQQAPGSYVIPIMVEGDDRRTNVTSNNNVQQSNARMNPTRSEPAKIVVQPRGPAAAVQEPGPVQSRSFRVLQKITDTDSNDVDTDQLRKLQLTEDDRILMNKFREQVDGENYLHQEEDPRYRGAAIPSRAFRFLQNMTDSGEISAAATAPRVQNVANKKQNRNSKSFEEMQANLPPSEQQVPEPKKYMGSAIPSRSFRILQAMTAPESVGPDATDY